MSFLDLTLFYFCPYSECTTLTYRDLFKLMLPIGWTVIAVLAVMAYIFTPLSQGDDLRWESTGVVVLSAAAGIGLCLATYEFHRTATAFAIEENCNHETVSDRFPNTIKQIVRCQSLQIHITLSTLFSFFSLASFVFFGVFATDLDRCAHESCGPDVAWSGMALVVSVLWMGVTYLGYRDLKNILSEMKTLDLDSKV